MISASLQPMVIIPAFWRLREPGTCEGVGSGDALATFHLPPSHCCTVSRQPFACSAHRIQGATVPPATFAPAIFRLLTCPPSPSHVERSTWTVPRSTFPPETSRRCGGGILVEPGAQFHVQPSRLKPRASGLSPTTDAPRTVPSTRSTQVRANRRRNGHRRSPETEVLRVCNGRWRSGSVCENGNPAVD